ncbi:FtsW/RodA/SpoVE family cell cycle protein [Sphingomonas quercus]|uniref:Probable peptidoglycan glycosyltransferase FtsW n=1 Tax=Sphingomonas quercus TaxID=2842451 RepID=A0ABS6BIX6_9SPHN|nr:putative peptidoglycan glycosyltransferase FtsW [Sphingomonas quercus]MBU3077771.1 putative lipid II flippase FtsW [Sphingomonas quercus]
MTGTVVPQPARRRRSKFTRIGGRGDMSAIGRWFWEIDRVLLLLVTVLISVGLLAVAAASPAAGARYSGGAVQFAPLHYFWRQLLWLMIGVPVMIGISMLPKETARRFALGGAAAFVVALMLVPLLGVEVNGARRWIGVGLAQFQPSEFLKPFYVVSLAWLLSLRTQDRKLPVLWVSAGFTALIGGLLMLQPDFGQSVMFALMWGALVMLSGAPMRLIAWLGGGAVGLVLAAYEFYPVATLRINNFLHGQGDTYQVDMAHATITGGGLFGTGPGAGIAKFRLPEAHTDYIFSVIGEEFGLVACLAVAALYLAIVVRVFVKLLDQEDNFLLYAGAGLAVQFGAQALINMAVNVGIAPSKGMTLPFISYGGSSMIALSIGMGLLLAFTRRNPYLQRSPYVTVRTQA